MPYNDAAAVASASTRAACALIRVLLEAFLKRHLAAAGQPQDQHVPLAKLIEEAVTHLALSQPLKAGLTAIRKRGNTTMHDPYGLTDDTHADDTHADDLPWLFQAVDDLVDDLHAKPGKWASIAGS